VGCICWICLATTAFAQLQLGVPPPVVIRGGTGAVVFAISNPGNQPVALDLKASDFIDSAARTTLTRPKVAFSLVPGNGSPPSTLGPEKTVEIEAKVTDFDSSSEASTTLFNGAVELGQLTATAIDAPLNVAVDGEGTPDKPLTYSRITDAILTLKNGDSEAYPVEWQLFLDGKPVGAAPVAADLPPNGTVRIALKPNLSAYSWTDWIHPSTRTGTLILGLRGPDKFPRQMLPQHLLPVSLAMSPSTPMWAFARSYFYVAFVLFLGGILSLLASALLPNLLRKIALRNQIADLANRTSSVSTRVDSYIRVLLRLERTKINMLLDDAGLLSLAEGEVFDQAAVAMDRLTRRLVTAERMDDLWRRFEIACATAPPSLTNEVDKTIQAAALSLAGEDLDAGSRLLDKAAELLNLLDDPNALAKRIAANFKELLARKALFPAPYADLQTALGGVFAILDHPYGDPTNLGQQMFFALDHDIAAIHTALDYAMVRFSTASAATANCAAAGLEARERLIQRECELVNLLGTLSWGALREATILVQEMRENIYVADVLEELGKDKQAEIVFDTQKARPYLPVFFSISFKDPRFNGAAAIGRLSSHWSLPKDLIEHGWKICHYFEAEDASTNQEHRVPVEATVRSRRHPEQQKILKHAIAVQPRKADRENSRLFAEGVRFFIAFGVALAGLLSGALEQLSKLDFLPATIAILALGFGADSIKNLLTQAPKKPPAS
jgi:hypothetical protein